MVQDAKDGFAKKIGGITGGVAYNYIQFDGPSISAQKSSAITPTETEGDSYYIKRFEFQPSLGASDQTVDDFRLQSTSTDGVVYTATSNYATWPQTDPFYVRFNVTIDVLSETYT